MSKKIEFGTTHIEIPRDYIRNNKIINPLTKTSNLTTRKKVKSINIERTDTHKPIITYEGNYTQKVIKERKKRVKKPIKEKVIKPIKVKPIKEKKIEKEIASKVKLEDINIKKVPQLKIAPVGFSKNNNTPIDSKSPVGFKKNNGPIAFSKKADDQLIDKEEYEKLYTLLSKLLYKSNLNNINTFNKTVIEQEIKFINENYSPFEKKIKKINDISKIFLKRFKYDNPQT